MTIYILIFCFLNLLCLFDLIRISSRIKVVLFWVVNVALVAFSGLRWKSGLDWTPYYRFFKDFNSDNPVFWLIYEPGYTAMTYLVKNIGDDYSVFLLVFSSFVILFRAYFFHRYTKYIFVGLLIFWGNTLAEVFPIRQSLAISICMLSMPAIVNRQFFKHLIIVIIAMQFHATAVIWLVAYFVFTFNWSVGLKIGILVAAILVGLGGFLNAVFSVLESTPIFGRLSMKAGEYAKMGSDTTFGANKTVTILTGLSKRALIFPILLYFDYKLNDKLYSRLMNLFIFGNVLYFLVIDFLAIQRVATYFYTLEIILLCKVLESIKEQRSRVLWFIMISLYAFTKMIFILSASKIYVIPYYWIFSSSFERVW